MYGATYGHLFRMVTTESQCHYKAAENRNTRLMGVFRKVDFREIFPENSLFMLIGEKRRGRKEFCRLEIASRMA